MGLPLRQLRDEAMQLPEDERRALAEELLESVDGTWEDAWLAEAQRRSSEGHDDARPWTEVRLEILRRLGKQ
jgi:hypothetical protein